jgi:hypothetical protein
MVKTQIDKTPKDIHSVERWIWQSDASDRGSQFPTTEIAQAVGCPVPLTGT